MSAFEALHRRHLSDARRVARIVSDTDQQADDIVAEAFARALAKVRAGTGPTDVLTPYLRIVVRRLAVDRHRARSREGHPADSAMLDELPTVDDVIAPQSDRDLVRAAFESLPERWQRVLWHTEIEGRRPASLVPALGGSPNAVAALAYRAREGLRQAFLAIHLAASTPPLCRPYVPKLAAYIRRALPEQEDVSVAIHLDVCAQCRERRDQLLLLVSDLRGVLVPALLGAFAASGASTTALVGAAALARTASNSDSVAGATLTGGSGGDTSTGSHRRPPRFVQVAATAVVSAAAAAAVAFAAISAIGPPSRSDEQVGAPSVGSSQIEPATAGTPTADLTVPEPTEGSPEPPGRTAEPADEVGESATESDPATESDATTEPSAGLSQATGSATAEDQPSTAEQPESPPTNRSDDEPDEPASTKEANADPDRESDARATGSDEEQGNSDPGRPPPSPWMCNVLKPVLPWCD
ncbi:MAG TPA: sigma-70 family RNA polymerase sigma factor [Jiangellaceae bacterium]